MEQAWARHALTLDRPVFALARLRRATVLFDRAGLSEMLAGGEGRARLLDRVRGRGGSARAQAEGSAVELAVARWRGVPDRQGLLRILGPEPVYLSVGHAGLDARGLGALAALPGARTGVLVHDTIPLDLPFTQKPGAAERFRLKLGAVARWAGLVVAPLESTGADIRRHLTALGARAEMIVAPLGVTPPVAGVLTETGTPDRPYFVALGTIEPRKNHALLLDLWDGLGDGPEVPRLVIVGRRGWGNEDVFARLDAARGRGRIIEMNDLADPETAALVSGARGLLFPSLAEGFGYPPLEAAALGTPVVASPLPQIRELLGDTIIYASTDELYQWRRSVEDLTRARPIVPPRALPEWQGHFNAVLSSLG